ncbi:hypothetical protein BDZ45DRAFT_674480 [Acephala macrosclerotiorum]|nr:hypothetical protein BDZ45DRAFT_674480 [Acephala macrosclerotiorum]
MTKPTHLASSLTLKFHSPKKTQTLSNTAFIIMPITLVVDVGLWAVDAVAFIFGILLCSTFMAFSYLVPITGLFISCLYTNYASNELELSVSWQIFTAIAMFSNLWILVPIADKALGGAFNDLRNTYSQKKIATFLYAVLFMFLGNSAYYNVGEALKHVNTWTGFGVV